MLSKPSHLALSGIAIACGAFLGACNDSPRLQFLTVAPKNGEIYVSAKPAAGVKGAAVHHARPAQQAPRTTGRHPAALLPAGTAACGSFEYAPLLFSARDPQKTGPAPPPEVPQALLQPRFTIRGLLRNCARRGSVVGKTAYSP